MATKLLEIYKCEVCGNIVEMVHGGAGELVCCEQPMKLFDANTVDAAKEKHVPVIELIADGTAYRKFLNPGDKPEATFNIRATQLTAREYCNLHGLWKGELAL